MILLLLGLMFSAPSNASDFPAIGDQASYLFITESGEIQHWNYEVSNSDLRIYSAVVKLDVGATTTRDFLLGSTPFYSRYMNAAASDRNCNEELYHNPPGSVATRETVYAAGQSIMTCHVHSLIDGASYDVWYGLVPFNKVKIEIHGGQIPGRYMVEPGVGYLNSYQFARKQQKKLQDETLFPSVMNFGNQVQVRVFNHTDKSYQCSGPIYMYSNMGQFKNDYYFDMISPKMTSYRSFYFFGGQPGEMIMSVSHGINCFSTNLE